ncbi:hypothetical protein Pyn_00543 [Prunus yedoensis var. nudiflora]|uniref:Uncharacterized protein n=1 Tax=Prunus yedoensis var. nudiflora TaxID=2094558 RepID=A0A314UM09_PRUYE|nr:hypothetical protein Pyn_00543 [Prunus yedoensis var. nudiflora]
MEKRKRDFKVNYWHLTLKTPNSPPTTDNSIPSSYIPTTHRYQFFPCPSTILRRTRNVEGVSKIWHFKVALLSSITQRVFGI